MREGLAFWGGIFGLAAALNILLGWHVWPAVFAGHLTDPDSYMRLLRLGQGVAAGHLTNIVARDDGGAGVLVEWSRLLDLLLCVMAAPLVPLLGWTRALFVAGVASGPLAVGGLGVALAFATRPLAEDRLLWAAAVAAAVLPGLADFATPGVVHYHVLLMALIAASLGCVLRACRGNGDHGFAAGAFGGLAIWLTPETMPFILFGFAALVLRWAGPGQQNRIGGVLMYCAAGFVDVIGMGFVIDPPQGGYIATEVDRLSLVYVVLALLFLAAAQLLFRLPKLRLGRLTRPAGLAAAAGLLLAWVALFPKVVEGPYGLMDAAARAGFFGAMLETRPLHGATDFRGFLLPGVLALGYALWRAGSARAWGWAYAGFGILVTLVLADRFLLFTEFPAGVAAALLPVAMSEAGQRLRHRPVAAMAGRLAVLSAVVLLPGLPAPGGAHGAPPNGFPSCDLLHIDTLLGGDRDVIVLAEAQDTPELLYRTPVLTVGSLYQHGLAGYFRAREAWRAPPTTMEPAAVKATGAKLILFCPGAGRYAPLAGATGTLWDALAAGHPPPWLTLRNADAATGWRVFAVHG